MSCLSVYSPVSAKRRKLSRKKSPAAKKELFPEDETNADNQTSSHSIFKNEGVENETFDLGFGVNSPGIVWQFRCNHTNASVNVIAVQIQHKGVFSIHTFCN